MVNNVSEDLRLPRVEARHLGEQLAIKQHPAEPGNAECRGAEQGNAGSSGAEQNSAGQYHEARALIASALKFGINPSLEPMRRIVALLGNPQQSSLCVQVAGTNGKSSTARYLASLLRAHGKRVGLYTSPELIHIEERIEIDGAVIARGAFAQAVLRVHKTAAEHELALTEFELLTATALLLFKEQEVEYSVLEVGLGGRWDATSIVQAQMAVITGIDYDHTEVLGTTYAQIAVEKAAIVKPCTKTLVLAPVPAEAQSVIVAQAATSGSRLIAITANGTAAEYAAHLDGSVQELRPLAQATRTALDTGSNYQALNRCVAFAAVFALLPESFNAQLAEAALDNTPVPGRFECVRAHPFLLIDAAHNPQSAATLARALAHNYDTRSMTLLLGILDDKDARGIIAALAPLFGTVIATQSSSPRAILAQDLAMLVEECGFVRPYAAPTVAAALAVLNSKNAPAVATGSITLAGEVKALICPQIS